MRSDGVLPYEFVEERSKSQLTGHAGLLPYIDLTCALGLLKAVDEKVGVRSTGLDGQTSHTVSNSAESGWRGVRGRHQDTGIGRWSLPDIPGCG